MELARNFSPFSSEKMDQFRRDVGVLHDEMQHHLVGHIDGPTDHPFWV